MNPADTANGKSGTTRNIIASAAQMKTLKGMLESGDLVSGETVLTPGVGASFDEEDLIIPEGADLKGGTRRDRSRRRLAVTKGDKPILVVKVTDSAGKARGESAAAISDDIFGTGVDHIDTVNLKSQLFDCSFGQLNVQPGTYPDTIPGSTGVIEATIGVSLEGNSRGTIRNAVTTAVQNLLGHGLPGPYQQVMYVLEGCYQDCGWAAYGE